MRRAAVLLLITASCDPQADSAYQGEPLVTLRGYVSSSNGQTPLEAAMLWQRGPPPSTNDVDLATRAPVQAGFPATFTVHLYQPPPAAARRSLAAGEIAFARANAAAVPYGVAAAGVASLPAMANVSYGIDAHHWVVYLAAAGFYLMRVAAVSPGCVTSAQLDACVADLAQRGIADRATAVSFCLEPYKLSLAPPGEQIVLDLGTVSLGPPGSGCP